MKFLKGLKKISLNILRFIIIKDEDIRSDDWYISDFGSHETYERWKANGEKDVLEEALEKVTQILKSHEPLPLDDDVEKELDKICKRAKTMT
jgi:trimethylamine:corrinoid methyltransferase-like protein